MSPSRVGCLRLIFAFSTGVAVLSTAHASGVKLPPKVEECRIAAGFLPDLHFNAVSEPHSVVVCREAVRLHPEITVANAFLGRSLYQHGAAEESFRWIKISADAGDPVGLTLLGIAYDEGFGTPAHRRKAIEAYELAAAKGQVNAHFNLALDALDRTASKADVRTGLPHLTAAIAKGFPPALNVQAWLLIRGVGRPKDDKAGLALYRQAADTGDTEAMYNWAVLSLESDPEAAITYLRTASERKSLPAMALLGELLWRGRLTLRDDVTATKLLKEAAHSSRRAAWVLAVMSSQGRIAGMAQSDALNLLTKVHRLQLAEMNDVKGDEPPWDVGVELTHWEMLERFLYRIGNKHELTRRRVVSAIRAHDLISRVGVPATREMLEDALSLGQIDTIREGARQVTADLSIDRLTATLSSSTSEAFAQRMPAPTTHPGLNPVTTGKASLLPAQMPNRTPSATSEFNNFWSRGDAISQQLAVRVLTELDAGTAASLITKALPAKQEGVREEILRMLSSARVPVARQFILNQLKDKNPGIRAMAIVAAAKNRLTLSPSEIAILTLDAEVEVKEQLLYYSDEGRWALPPDFVLNGLRSANPKVREAAVRAARRQTSSSIRSELISMLDGPLKNDIERALRYARVEHEALELIRGVRGKDLESGNLAKGEIVSFARPQSLATPLEEMLNDSEPQRRKQALWAIYHLGAPLHIELLERVALTDPDPIIRRMAIEALLTSKDLRAEHIFEKATRDQDPFVRRIALEGVDQNVKLGEKYALRMVHDADSLVRYRAAAILKNRTTKEAGDAVAKLKADPDRDIRELVEKRAHLVDVAGLKLVEDPDFQSFRTLPLEKRVPQLCQMQSTKPGLLEELTEIAIDPSNPAQLRNRALHCATYPAGYGVSNELVSKLHHAALDPTNASNRFAILNILEKASTLAAARSVLELTMYEPTSCEIRVRMAEFPPLARNEAARHLLRHPNPLVQQHTLACMGADGVAVKFAVRKLLEKNEKIAETQLELLTRIGSPEAAPALLDMLSHSLSDEERADARQALWLTKSQAGHDDAVVYRGRLSADGQLLNAWVSALVAKPSEAGLIRLLAELPRALRNEDLALAAISVSAATPDAVLDIGSVSLVADELSEAASAWRIRRSNRLFSPLAYLATCLSARDEPEWLRDLDPVNGEYQRVLPIHHAALKSTLVRCVEARRAAGKKLSGAMQAWGIRLLLNAGLNEDALRVPAGEDAHPYSTAAFLLARAEVLVRSGKERDALQILDQVDANLLTQLGARDRRDDIQARVYMLRGHAAVGLNDGATSLKYLAASADRSGRTATGIVAFGMLLKHGYVDTTNRARWIANNFELSDQSGPQVFNALQAILVYLVEKEVENKNPEQSLIDADRLAVLMQAQYRLAPATLANKDKEYALLQLKELESRVQEAQDPRRRPSVVQGDATPEDPALARQRLQVWMTEMRVRYPAMVSLLRPSPIDLVSLRKALGESRTLIQYVLLPNRGFAWILTQDQQMVVSLPSSSEDIHQWVAEARSGLLGLGSAEAEVAMGKLSDALIEPIRKAMRVTDHWIVVPHSSLHALPFAALPWAGTKEPLIAHKIVSYAPSASAVQNFRMSSSTATNKLLAIGGPTPLNGIDTGLLPQAQLEARNVATYSENAQVHTGPDAKKGLILERSLQATSLHLAVHGQFLPNDQSRLIFADGFLTLKEVWGLNLERSPRVVLSACESGLGQSTTGNEILSLANGFLFAGAESVASTLWKVSDQETRLLMEDFYWRLSKGRSTAEAMAEAQRKAITEGKARKAWASFTVYGL